MEHLFSVSFSVFSFNELLQEAIHFKRGKNNFTRIIITCHLMASKKNV